MTLCAHWAHLAHAFVLLGLQLLLAAGAPWLKLSHHGNFSSMAASLFKLLEQLPVVSPRTKSGHKKPERLHLLFGNLLDVVKVLVLDKVHQVSLVFLLKRTVRTTQLCHLQSPPSVPTFSLLQKPHVPRDSLIAPPSACPSLALSGTLSAISSAYKGVVRAVASRLEGQDTTTMPTHLTRSQRHQTAATRGRCQGQAVGSS